MSEMVRPNPAQAIGDQVARLRQMWTEAFNGRDVDFLAGLYAPDAVLLLPDAPAAIGRDAIRELVNNLFRTEKRHLQVHEIQVEYTGPLAVEIATYILMQPGEHDPKQAETGRLVTTWRRDNNGEFQITISVWSNGPAE